MYQYKGIDDTIAAIATAQGPGGIGIVRISGPDAFRIAERLFRPRGKVSLQTARGYSVHYGWVMASSTGEVVDEVLVTVMRAPRSYTAEDTVEISCHGGSVAVRTVLTMALEAGARLAEPGEFTKRAFLNGRIDLTQAEAVLDIIHAKTDAFLRVSTHQLKGELSTQLEDIRVQLMRIYTTLEAFVNFPEDEIDEQNRTNICDDVSEQRQRVADLLTSSHNGRLLREGIRVVLCGKPNVGKSSLLNVLLKTQRAIVTDIAGTTRDVIEEAARIGDLPFQLVDTAGILEPRDLVEEEAIKRSHLYIDSADLVLMVFDLSRPLEKQDEMLIEKVRNQKTVVVFNKADLPDAFDVAAVDAALPGCKKVMLSTLTREGQGDLEKAILETVLDGGSLDPHGLMISNVRHIQSLKEAERALESARRLMTDAVSLEFVSEEIKQAVNALDGITGRNIDADLLDRIFSDFCIGK